MRTSPCEKLAINSYFPDESNKRDENGIRVRPTVRTKKAFVGIAEYVGVDPAVLGKMVIDRFVEAFMDGKITREEFLFGRD